VCAKSLSLSISISKISDETDLKGVVPKMLPVGRREGAPGLFVGAIVGLPEGAPGLGVGARGLVVVAVAAAALLGLRAVGLLVPKLGAKVATEGALVVAVATDTGWRVVTRLGVFAAGTMGPRGAIQVTKLLEALGADVVIHLAGH